MRQALKRWSLSILGWLLLLVGIAALPLPGPGAMIILLAMVVLATQYEWAARRLDGVKAIFFVKSFEGKQHDDLRFYDDREPMDCLWVRVTFHDDEVIEGIIRNDPSFVFNSCFLMSPVDPEGNNWLIYVIKTQLKNFQVLGLRPAPKQLPDLVHRTAATSIV